MASRQCARVCSKAKAWNSARKSHVTNPLPRKVLFRGVCRTRLTDSTSGEASMEGSTGSANSPQLWPCLSQWANKSVSSKHKWNYFFTMFCIFRVVCCTPSLIDASRWGRLPDHRASQTIFSSTAESLPSSGRWAMQSPHPWRSSSATSSSNLPSSLKNKLICDMLRKNNCYCVSSF